jgi:hypothetical protein
MTRTLLALMLGGASTASALAAVGGVLYAGHPQLLWVLQCFAGWGFAAGLVCGVLHLRAHGRPVHAPPALSTSELHSLVRAAEASAKAERQARGARAGSAADRRAAPAPADLRPQEVAVTAAPALPKPPVREEADAVATP